MRAWGMRAWGMRLSRVWHCVALCDAVWCGVVRCGDFSYPNSCSNPCPSRAYQFRS